MKQAEGAYNEFIKEEADTCGFKKRDNSSSLFLNIFGDRLPGAPPSNSSPNRKKRIGELCSITLSELVSTPVNRNI